MTCAACVRRVEQGIQALPGIHRAEVNFATERATVDYDDALLTPADIREVVKDLG
jgi:Cu+-exporting ATPase